VRSPVGTLIDRATALLSPRNDAPPYVPASSNPLFSGALRADDKATQLRAMGAVGTLFAIVNRLSVDTAAVDWHMHRLVTPRRTPARRASCATSLASSTSPSTPR
jgi:hypothetical protein